VEFCFERRSPAETMLRYFFFWLIHDSFVIKTAEDDGIGR